MSNKMKKLAWIIIAILSLMSGAVLASPIALLNVSYDPTRELFDEYNKLFIKHWKEKSGQDVSIQQSHGGSGKQARSVIDGLPADVVSLALAYDIDAIAEKSKALPQDWQTRLLNNSSPYTSTIVFLVKKDNPKNIKNWDDLVREDVKVITPNPKTSGGARWNYLAAWGYALEKNNNSEEAAKEFIKKLFKNVPILDTGARSSTITFVQRGIGDVLISWENEAFLAINETGKDKFEVVVPSISVLAEPPVAVIDKYANKKGNAEIAKEYLAYLYSKEAQEIIAKHYYRPSDPEVAAKYASTFPVIRMMKIADFGGWSEVQKKHFDEGKIFDQVYLSK